MGYPALNGEYLIELFSFAGSPSRPSCPEAIGLRHPGLRGGCHRPAPRRADCEGDDCEPIRTDPHTGRAIKFVVDPDGLPLELYER
jgi:glyoxylase I family protein